MRVDSREGVEDAWAAAWDLCDRGDAGGAVALAHNLEGDDPNLPFVRAGILIDAGVELGYENVIEVGADILRPYCDAIPEAAYNVGNAEAALWELAISRHGLVDAFTRCREHLVASRRLYEDVGLNEEADLGVRKQALTNLGNSYSKMGRDVDAIAVFDRVLDLDPEFAMAHGNRGSALRRSAYFMGPHAATALHDSALAYDKALARPDDVIRVGGVGALETFRADRLGLPDPKANGHDHIPARWEDPYLAWCLGRKLFLHVSHACLRPTDRYLDPVHMRGLVGDSANEDDPAADARRMEILFDAFNTIKQDYITARYVLWLATEGDAEGLEHAHDSGSRTLFHDSLTYARWGVRTGLGLQAFTASFNVLDKVACLAHLYLRTTKTRTQVAFRGFWATGKKMDVDIARELEAKNFGLLALCDLSTDLERPTALQLLVQRRHTATHRFLVAHSESIHVGGNDPAAWHERQSWTDLTDGTTSLLGTARAAIIYLARMIDEHEERRRSAMTGPVMTFDVPDALGEEFTSY